MKIAFLDRDGVINIEKNYLHKIEDFEYTYNCKKALKVFLKKGFKIIIITNQAGIGKGLFSEKDYNFLTKYYLDDLLKSDIPILDVFYCPHHPNAKIEEYKKDCNNRKPKPGMLIKAAKKYNIDMKESILVGDKSSDMLAGMNAGIEDLFLVKSNQTDMKESIKNVPIYNNLYEISMVI